MSKVCQVTGKRPMTGNNVSHANNKKRRRFLPNLHVQRFWLETEKRWVSLRVSGNGLRTIEKVRSMCTSIRRATSSCRIQKPCPLATGAFTALRKRGESAPRMSRCRSDT